MSLVSQTAAAAYVRRDSRTIRYWLKNGKLKRRENNRVALEDVKKLAGPDNRLKKRGVVGGLVRYSRAGRPKQTNAFPSPWILRPDADGHCRLWGKPIQVNADTPPMRDLTDVERLLEIRVFGWILEGIKLKFTADQLWEVLPSLRSQYTGFFADLPTLPIETRLFHLLRNTTPREIFVITARLVYDCAHKATGDAAPRNTSRSPIPKWNPKKEQSIAYLCRHFGKKNPTDDQDKERSAKLTPEERHRRSLKITEDYTVSADESLFRLAADHPDIQLPPEKRKAFEAWKNLDDQAFRETKYGHKISGMEEYRGKIRPVRLKRWYRLGDILGTSRRMATYWKKRTNSKYQKVVSELRRVTPNTVPYENPQTLGEEIENVFIDEQNKSLSSH